ncbi:alpha/beta hydrolase [Actinoallomurus sp. NPDC050550]|uniref:alpha/beta hydrolase n=1 Tax=Actinoallomurus sp. NPDC050550 TaxID=3154937 RepID=UPI0033F9B9B5
MSRSDSPRRYSPARRATLIATSCVVASAVGLAVTSASAAPRTDARLNAVSVPAPHWSSCDTTFQCATIQAPLDYRHPDGEKISIAMIRHPATDPAHRLGSLFFNPGGPGGSGVGNLPYLYDTFPARMRARYDIVSFDPRGVGASTAPHCFPTTAAEKQFLSVLPDGIPVGQRQEKLWENTYARFDAICGERDHGLLEHVTTADTARDMDLMRQAVGDPVLNYYGISYGTVLGATYANLFPDRVGHVILDGNVDPIAWTHSEGGLSTSLREGSDLASAATLKGFLSLCGRAPVSGCAFSAGSLAATQAKFNTMLRRLQRNPVTLGTKHFTYGGAVADMVGALYTTSKWQSVATTMQDAWLASTGRKTSAGDQVHSANPTPTASPGPPYMGQEQGLDVVCSESPDPRDPREYPALARRAYARSGALGPEWVWVAEEACATWPAANSPDRYTGPWNRRTANPVLLIGNTGDPATPYWGSIAMSRELARAELLTVDGYGHTEFGNPSTCAADYEAEYMTTGALPPHGTVCHQDRQPF